VIFVYQLKPIQCGWSILALKEGKVKGNFNVFLAISNIFAVHRCPFRVGTGVPDGPQKTGHPEVVCFSL